MVLAAAVALPLVVDFSAPAAPASRLVPEIGKAYGVTLEVAPTLAREVLLIQAKAAPLNDLLERVATVTGGEWEGRDGVYRLVLSAGAVAKERRTEVALREAAFRKELDRRLGRVGNGSGRSGDSAGRVVDAVLDALPAGTLGGLGSRERVVFSTNPTARQRALPSAALRGLDFTPLARIEAPIMGDATTPPPGRPVVANLVLQTLDAGSRLFASFATADAAGRVVGVANETLYAYSATETVAPKLPQPKAALSFSDVERRRAAALQPLDGYLQSIGRGGEENETGDYSTLYSSTDLVGEKVSARVPELLKPETEEPLALVAGPVLTRFAEAEGTSLVADIPDSAFLALRPLVDERAASADRVALTAQTNGGLEVAVANGWTLLRPKRPIEARAARLDRVALGTALRTLANAGGLNLDAQAAYAMAQPIVEPTESFEGAVFGAVDPSYGRRIALSSPSGQRLVLRLYRALGPTASGTVRPVGSLPGRVRDLLDELVYQSVSGPLRSFSYGNAKGRGTFLYPGGLYTSPWTMGMERTDYWPNGVPGDAVLRVAENVVPATFGMAPNGSRPLIQENSMGYSISRHGNEPPVVATTLPRLAQYARGTMRTLSFTLSGAPGATLTRSLREEWLDPKLPAIAYGDLPVDLRQRIDSLEEQARRAADNSGPRDNSRKP